MEEIWLNERFSNPLQISLAPKLFNVNYNAPVPKGLLVFSFFAGAGFLDLGFEMAGFRTVFANEVNSQFREAYQFARNKMGVNLPFWGISNESIEKYLEDYSDWLVDMVTQAKKNGIVGFIGGPPCPDFSVGGKNRGRHGDNGKLTKTYFDLIRRHKPDWFLFENVKGLWSTKRHRKFYDEQIQSVLTDGYAVSDRLINSIEYGAPQDRERIIAIGFSPGLASKLGLSPGMKIENEKFPWFAHAKYPEENAFSHAWPTINGFGADDFRRPNSIPLELTVQHWFEKNDVVHHPNASNQFKPRAGLLRFQAVHEGDDSKKSFKRLHRWRYSPTACYGNNEVHLHPYLPRRISVAEALAIQSLPKDFELPQTMTLSAMFKTVGNGVPFLAAKAIALTIKEFITNKK
jgi:DNA (cytosine-5)-methyltransferase 1